MSMIRVITANLLNGRAAPSVLRRLIRAERPHIFAAQELAPNAARVLEEEFPHGRLDPRVDYHGVGLALRYEADVKRLPLAHRDGLQTVLEQGTWPELGRPVEIISVHLANPILRPVRRSMEIRRRQTEQLLGHVSNRRPRVLTGDFNASPLWPLYRRLSAEMTDAARATESESRTWAPTWWMPRLLRIDHVFVQDLTPVRVRVRRVRRSDHSAVIADLDTT